MMDLATALAARAGGERRRILFLDAAEPRITEVLARLAASPRVLPCVLDRERAAAVSGVEVVTVAPSRVAEFTRALSAQRDLSNHVAERLLDRPANLSLALLAAGRVDALMLGVSSHTSDVLVACQMMLGLREGASIPTSTFLLEVERSADAKQLLVFADCAVHPDPTPEQLAEIAIQAADAAASLAGMVPRVALLSFSTHGSASHPDAEKVARATAIARERRPELSIDGELQVDTALDPTAAAHKLDDVGGVAGHANVLVFPDLNAANIAYKLVRALARAPAFGVFLEGYQHHVAKISRGATPDEIAMTATLLASRAAVVRRS